ncbi:hypothetical protein [Hyphomonas atlantica corrig.]|uniref:hypothetical protein n=1 Tax=Hyphomonas atlantica TaxID=1280948 RepID=UPI00235390AF|nr:hypothetical protein [Hyphomonas atlantica]
METDGQRLSVPNPLPVTIVESEEQALDRKSILERTELLEQDNLVAQQGVNAATQRMADYALWQTMLVFIGTVALLFTLYLTRQANKAAQNAVRVTERIGRAQLKANIEVTGGRFVIDSDDTFKAFLVFRNTGQSSAKIIRFDQELSCLKQEYTSPPRAFKTSRFPEWTVPAGESRWHPIGEDADDADFVEAVEGVKHDGHVWLRGTVHWVNLLDGSEERINFDLSTLNPFEHFGKSIPGRVVGQLWVLGELNADYEPPEVWSKRAQGGTGE